MVVCSLDGRVNFDLHQMIATVVAVVVVVIVFHNLALLNMLFIYFFFTEIQSKATSSGRNYVIWTFILSSGNLANANHFF